MTQENTVRLLAEKIHAECCGPHSREDGCTKYIEPLISSALDEAKYRGGSWVEADQVERARAAAYEDAARIVEKNMDRCDLPEFRFLTEACRYLAKEIRQRAKEIK